ncbi:MAG: TatD family hydrolase [Bacteroidales bacterium]|nr:TatD family hydrolase [Bacteroidales bacterium]
MKLIDTHSHIYGEEFDGDIAQVIERAKASGVEKIFLPNIDLSTVERLLFLAKTDAEMFSCMIGLYPGSVTGEVERQLDEILPYVKLSSTKAIGEIGLDFYWSRDFYEEQIHAFKTQLQWSKNMNNIPFSIHCRKAFDEILRCLKEDGRESFNGVFHCFSGDISQANKVLEMGFYLGIGGVLTFKNAHLVDVIKNIPLSNIVLETDAPYLAPVPHRGKRNEPSFVRIVAEKIAEIKNITLEEVAEITSFNAERMMKLC